MKVIHAFCDIHTDLELAPASIETLSSFGDVNTIDTARCTNLACVRNYTRHFGYFDAPIGEAFKLGDVKRKPRCGWNHHVEYMVLTKLDGILTWACPVGNCGVTKPFGLETPFTLHPAIRSGDGPDADSWSDVVQYRVVGLPAGEEAWIGRNHSKWSCLRATNGVQGQWTGVYNSLNEALESLTAGFEAPSAV